MRERSLERRETRLARETHPANYVASILVNGAFLWVMNALPGWNVPYLLDSYTTVLPAINLSLSVQLSMNLVLIFYHPRFFHHLAQVVTTGFSIYAIAAIARVFPLDFSSIPMPSGAPSLNLLVRFALFVGIGGLAIGAVVHAFKFLGRIFRGDVES